MNGPAQSGGEPAREAYEAFASIYDDFNHRYQYARWTGRLLGVAEGAGLRGKRLLDVGCGTGLSFVALLERGFEVTACDISPAMLARAAERLGEDARVVEADMSRLPELGEFDLVWAVNDAVNYLSGPPDLEATLAGMGRNLAAGGLVLFDLNTLATFRGAFSEREVVERNGRRFVWNGLASAREVHPGMTAEARIEAEDDPGLTHVHRQRHFGEAETLAAIAAAGLRSLGVWGELDGELEPGLDEDRHTKAVYVCGAAP